MFRLWAKEWKQNRMIRDITICDAAPPAEKNRTKKVFDAIEEICYAFDLAKPIWLNSNISEFQRIDKTRFTSDNFIEEISFDYLEIQVIEED
ncbi:MAG: hypothetical protein LUH14_07365 [Clostridiaceae bacterium]|nr:hypothetical protein [Clostridiaceae bacterium]